MSEHSALPTIHHVMESIPFPGPAWKDVISEHPSLRHLQWSFVFVVASALLQSFCIFVAKKLGPSLMCYSVAPPLKGDKEEKEYLTLCKKHESEIAHNEQRFQESLFPMTAKALTLGFGILAFYDADWIYDRALLWKGWPYDQGLDCCAADIKLLYMVNTGWYLYRQFAHIFLDRTFNDAAAHLIHHFAAIGLLVVSYTFATVRAGIVVLLLHDPADLVFQSAKFCKLIHLETCCNILFVSLVFVWFVTRIVLFPVHVIGASYYDFYDQHGSNGKDIDFGAVAIALMCCLYALHLYWFYLLMMSVYRALTGGGLKDVRDDNDK